MTHRSEVQGPRQAGLDTQGGRHIHLGQCGHGQAVASALSQIYRTQSHVDRRQVAAAQLAYVKGGAEGVASDLTRFHHLPSKPLTIHP